MSSDEPPQTFDEITIDLFGQQPGLAIYTQIALIYSSPDEQQEHIVSTLKKGLQKLSVGFPWVAGQVINTGSSETSTGTYKIAPFEATPRLFVKDRRSDLPSFDEYEKAQFPFRMLKEEDVCPRSTIPGVFTDPSLEGVNPVMILQLTFIRGGFILAFLGQHQTMDGVGQDIMMTHLSQACRSIPFTRTALTSGNQPRTSIFPLLPSSTYTPTHIHNQLVPTPPPPPPPPTPHPPKWTYFLFPAPTLQTLKTHASDSLPPTVPYITTDDALTSLILHRLLRARSHRLPPSPTSSFARAVNIRPYIPSIPPLYPGMAQNMTYTTYDLTTPLSAIAASLRVQLLPESNTLARDTATLATLFSTSEDKRVANFTPRIDPGRDLMLSSWAGLGSYGLDFGFGVGVRIGAVRRPEFTGCEGLGYFMPRRGDGEVVVGICLREEDLEALREDGEWTRYATEIL